MSVATSNKAGSGERPVRIRTRLRKGDTVLVTTGKDRGKTGKILKMVGEKNRATVERLNMVKRHRKGQGAQSPGGIVEKEASLNLSNLRLVCGRCNKPTRINMRTLEDGKRTRQCHRCDELVDG
ncbi:MAG: 50S ribosomal protein L24 [Candidatus Binatia bacterium]|nr:50S ribosomal protein L24 [Candidatus Binatia bacterium]